MKFAFIKTPTGITLSIIAVLLIAFVVYKSIKINNERPLSEVTE